MILRSYQDRIWWLWSIWIGIADEHPSIIVSMSFDKFSHDWDPGISSTWAFQTHGVRSLQDSESLVKLKMRSRSCLFDIVWQGSLHWFLLLIGYLCIDMHCKIRSCLDGRSYYLSLLFFSEPEFRSVNLLPGNLRKTETPPWQLRFERLPDFHGNHGHFFRELHFGWTPGEMLLFSLAKSNWCWRTHGDRPVLWTTSVTTVTAWQFQAAEYCL